MNTRRRVCLVSGGIGLSALYHVTHAQTREMMRRIGVLITPSEAGSVPYVTAFKQGMAELGWQEGRNVEYRMAYASGDLNRLNGLAGELVAQEVELILASNTQATRAAHSAAPSLPVVMGSAANVVQYGLVASLARPGGSITGLTLQAEDLRAKLIEVLHEMVPGAVRIGVLLSGNSDITDISWAELRRACEALGLEAQRFGANVPSQIALAVEQIVRQRSQAVVVPSDGMYLNERVRLQALIQAARLPSAYTFREHAQAGGLFSQGANLVAMYRYVAKYVDKILKGAKPADLPVEQPTKFELVINMSTAKALGLTIPQSLLLRADEVIE